MDETTNWSFGGYVTKVGGRGEWTSGRDDSINIAYNVIFLTNEIDSSVFDGFVTIANGKGAATNIACYVICLTGKINNWSFSGFIIRVWQRREWIGRKCDPINATYGVIYSIGEINNCAFSGFVNSVGIKPLTLSPLHASLL